MTPYRVFNALKHHIKLRVTGKSGSLAQRYPQFRFGRHTYDDHDLRVHGWNEGAGLRVGAFCSIAAGVQIFLGGEHRADWVSTFPFSVLWRKSAGAITGHPATKGDVRIGNDVWIGCEAIILSGVTIGDGAIIGARAVVAGDVAPYAIVAGNPARQIRKRFDDTIIEELLDIRWWDWDDAKIEKFLPLLLHTDIRQFAAAAKKATD